MFLSPLELSKIKGLNSIGKNVLISDKVSWYGTNIIIGDNVRIDDFSILSGIIYLGDNIHIGAYCGLYGKLGIRMKDYTGLSPRCTIFSASDDFSGRAMISPMNPEKYCNVLGGVVILQKFVQIGCGTVIMPDLTIGTGAAIGAMSFVKRNIPEWGIFAGNPLTFIKPRDKTIIDLEIQYRNELQRSVC
jgi:acetyltransferase-like isoleucine patch superfamily enzyme